MSSSFRSLTCRARLGFVLVAFAGGLLARPTSALPLTGPTASPVETTPETTGGDEKGRIVEGPASAHAFNPTRSRTRVDASDIDLRAVFEDLGPDATQWYQHVTTLSNPFFEGRSAGTRGFEVATEYVEFWFRKLGLEPAFPDADAESDADWTSYVQPFSYAGRSRPNYTLEEAGLSIGDQRLEHEVDFAVLGPSGGASVTAPLSFVGYGIADGPDGYSSFAEDTDLSGRIAVIFRYEPIDADGGSRWSEERFSEHSSMRGKIRKLLEYEPAGIILVTPEGIAEAPRNLESLRSSAFWARSLDIPFLQVTPAVADRLLAAGAPELAAKGPDHPTLAAWRTQADEGTIGTVHLDEELEVTIVGRVTVEMVEAEGKPSANMGGVLRGRGDLADQWVVVGGHYDHIGYGRSGGLNPGADDNASGTAGVLVLAERFTRLYAEADEDANLRSILFMTFGAEEAGLIGSRHWAEHPTLDADSTVLMINLDMIGRLGEEVMLGGTGTAAEFDEMLIRHIEPSGLTVAAVPSGRGPSDHTNFYGAGIPVLFFFTGVHSEYHDPGDQGYTVDPIGAMRVLDLAESIAREVIARTEKLRYQ